MATPEQAIQEVSVVTGISHSRVWTTARAMREADEDLWPAGSKGRAMPRHVEPRHLGNLAIAIGLAAPKNMRITPDRVKAFRSLVQMDGYGSRPGLTFGDALDELIDIASRDLRFRAQVWTHQGPVIQLAPTQMAKAEISFGPGAGRYHAADPLSVALMMHVSVLGITNITTIDGLIIKMLAELWADSQQAIESKIGVIPGRTAALISRG